MAGRTDRPLRPATAPGEDRNNGTLKDLGVVEYELRPATAPGEDRNERRYQLRSTAPALRPATAPGEDRNSPQTSVTA